MREPPTAPARCSGAPSALVFAPSIVDNVAICGDGYRSGPPHESWDDNGGYDSVGDSG